jgi:NADH-quinone oxidoreductase subunit H
MVNVSALAVTVFLGGYQAPFGLPDGGWLGFFWFLAKVLTLLFGFVWLRGTLPRLRYDQFMALGWRVLIPVSLVWILAVAGLRLAGSELGQSQLIAVVVGIAVAMVVLSLLPWGRRTRAAAPPPQDGEPEDRAPVAPGYPVPPLPGAQEDAHA